MTSLNAKFYQYFGRNEHPIHLRINEQRLTMKRCDVIPVIPVNTDN